MLTETRQGFATNPNTGDVWLVCEYNNHNT